MNTGRLTYPEWKEQARRDRLKNYIHCMAEIVESVKGSAIFYSRKVNAWQMAHFHNRLNIRGVIVRIGEIIAALVTFAVLVGGLNIIAAIF